MPRLRMRYDGSAADRDTIPAVAGAAVLAPEAPPDAAPVSPAASNARRWTEPFMEHSRGRNGAPREAGTGAGTSYILFSVPPDSARWASCETANPPERYGVAVRTVLSLDQFFDSTMEGWTMDAHFNEYLAAVAGMRDLYGERGDDHPTDFHDVAASPVAGDPLACETAGLVASAANACCLQ